jgi:hypothetical protein
MSERKWSVEVCVDGENVLNISSDDLSGVSNVTDFRKEIIDAAEHLIAFTGREDSVFVIPDAETD